MWLVFVIVNRKGERMYKFEVGQIWLICRVSLILEMSPSCFSENLVVWYHKKGEVRIDFKEREMSIPTYPNNEILFFTFCGLALTENLEVCEVFED